MLYSAQKIHYESYIHVHADHYVVPADGMDHTIPVKQTLRESIIDQNGNVLQMIRQSLLLLRAKHVLLIIARDANDQLLKIFRVAIERKNGDYAKKLDYSSCGFQMTNNVWYNPNDPESVEFAKNRFNFFTLLKYSFYCARMG